MLSEFLPELFEDIFIAFTPLHKERLTSKPEGCVTVNTICCPWHTENIYQSFLSVDEIFPDLPRPGVSSMTSPGYNAVALARSSPASFLVPASSLSAELVDAGFVSSK